MAMLEISVLPVGQGESVSRYVAECLKMVKNSGMKHSFGPMGTVVEGDVESLFTLALKLHTIPFAMGAKRVVTSMKIDERTDRQDASIEQKLRSVTEKMQ